MFVEWLLVLNTIVQNSEKGSFLGVAILFHKFVQKKKRMNLSSLFDVDRWAQTAHWVQVEY